MSLKRQARQITLILFLAQCLSSAGFIAAATLNSILGAQLGGGSRWAGLPSAIYLLGSALAAYLWGYLMDLIGRRGGLVLGLILGAIGAGLATQAATLSSLPEFLVGMTLMGMANAAVVLGRFAAAEVHPPNERGKAISNVVIGGTFGSIFGPLLVAPAGNLAPIYGLSELAGAYAAALLLFLLAGLVIFLGLRPDPRELGKEVTRLYPEASPRSSEARSISLILRQPAAQVAIAAMVLGQVVMVMLMAITSLHMRQHQHGLGNISLVISAHTFGMYAFSLLSGRLADQWGRGAVIISGTIALLVACLTAPLSPQVLPLGVALFLLGLGWNFCFVGGSALLADQLSPTERARTQGFNDLLVGLASALAGLSSGLVFAAVGYEIMALLGAGMSLLPLMGTALWLRSNRQSRSPLREIGD